MKKVYNVRVECNANKYLMTDEEFCKGVEELILDELGDDADKVKITAELADKDHRIAVLERALKLAVRDGYYVADSEGFYFGACNSKTSHDFYEKTNYGEDEEKCIKLHCNYFIDQAEKELKDE